MDAVAAARSVSPSGRSTRSASPRRAVFLSTMDVEIAAARERLSLEESEALDRYLLRDLALLCATAVGAGADDA